MKFALPNDWHATKSDDKAGARLGRRGVGVVFVAKETGKIGVTPEFERKVGGRADAESFIFVRAKIARYVFDS